MMQTKAQRVVSPVDSNDLPQEVLLRKSQHEADMAAADTMAVEDNESKSKYDAPLLGGVLISADLAAPVMNLLGTQYGNYEVAAELDVYHRFFPVVELGVGYAKYHPEDNNYTYRTNAAIYGRIGLNYNFFYGNGSNSFVAIGARYGMTGFSYWWDNVTLNDYYWDSEVEISTPKQNAFAHWGEIVVALRVQVVKNFYMGWSGRYRLLIGCSTSPYGSPYYIPGMGVKDSGFGFTYTIGYQIPIKTKEPPKDVDL